MHLFAACSSNQESGVLKQTSDAIVPRYWLKLLSRVLPIIIFYSGEAVQSHQRVSQFRALRYVCWMVRLKIYVRLAKKCIIQRKYRRQAPRHASTRTACTHVPPRTRSHTHFYLYIFYTLNMQGINKLWYNVHCTAVISSWKKFIKLKERLNKANALKSQLYKLCFKKFVLFSCNVI